MRQNKEGYIFFCLTGRIDIFVLGPLGFESGEEIESVLLERGGEEDRIGESVRGQSWIVRCVHLQSQRSL